MINTDRIVPVQKTDLLTLYSVILKASGVTLEKLAAENATGEFKVTEAATGSYLCAEPLKSVDVASGVSTSFYFVAMDGYKGMTVNGSAATMAGDDIAADGSSLYKATVSGSTITIAAQGL